jgi:hypothetical protein
MSSATKTIDALELKRRLQESLQQRLEALSDEQRLDTMRELADGGPLGEWWKRLRESGAGAPDRDDARDSR